MLHRWKILDSKIIFSHQWYTLRQDRVLLPSGKFIEEYFVSVRKTVVIIIPFFSDRSFLLVREYKHGAKKIVTQFPTGLVEKRESALKAAQRELREETGYEAKKLQIIAQYCESPAKNTNLVIIVLAENLNKLANGKPLLDQEGETEIQVKRISFKELQKRLITGGIDPIESVAAGWVGTEFLRRRGQL